MNEFCVLLCTCKKYEFLVEPFLKLFKKYWPGFANKIYINSDGKFKGSELSDNLVVINNDNFVNWSDRLINSLKQIKEEYVLLVLDDFFFKGPVHQEQFEAVFEYQKRNKIKCVQFYPQNKLNKKTSFPNFVSRMRFAPYRISAQICMYEKKYLLKVARKKESPWEFELCGSFRSSVLYGGKIICATRNNNYIFDTDIGFLIVRGNYTEQIRRRFETDENIFLPELDNTKITNKNNLRFVRRIKILIKCIVSIFRR